MRAQHRQVGIWEFAAYSLGVTAVAIGCAWVSHALSNTWIAHAWWAYVVAIAAAFPAPLVDVGALFAVAIPGALAYCVLLRFMDRDAAGRIVAAVYVAVLSAGYFLA